MNVFLIIALVLFVLALICVVAPTTILGAGWVTWMLGGFISYTLAGLFGWNIKKPTLNQ